MPVHIALLRGINVSGQKLIKMTDLQTHFASFGALNIRTYIQSGNVVFEHRKQSSSSLELALEKHLASELGYSVPTLVIPAEEFSTIADGNPYDVSLPEFGKRMYVCFFKQPPSAASVRGMQDVINDDERLFVKNRAGYAYYSTGLGRAKLTSTVIERRLGWVTLRNWNTVTALLGLIDC